MRKYIAGVLTAGVLFCALRWADLALWTDRETGLVTAGPVWARYLALAVLAGLALLAGHRSAGPAGEDSSAAGSEGHTASPSRIRYRALSTTQFWGKGRVRFQ